MGEKIVQMAKLLECTEGFSERLQLKRLWKKHEDCIGKRVERFRLRSTLHSLRVTITPLA